MIRLIATAALFAQSASAPLTFEVASIKPSDPDARGTQFMFQPPNGVRIVNAPVTMLITFAYNIRDFQLVGAPGWTGSARYDILGKGESAPGSENTPIDPRKMTDEQLKTRSEEMRERMRSLLADRFQLAIHKETKEGSVYALVVAKGGSKLQPAQENAQGSRGMRMSRGELTGMSAPLQLLVDTLSGQLGHPVIDKTGLTGKYDFKLTWAPDVPRGPSPNPDAPPPSAPEGPSIFTAVQEQLGLRLESQKGPVEMIVIDRIEHPSEN
jgi:uncharacterized protein (TIGR03435 family)